MNVSNISLRLITDDEKSHFHRLMDHYHYLGSRRAVGESLHYLATYQDEWVALLSFSSATRKCAARDQWIGWSYRHQYDRLLLATNNSRFLILPQWHYPNVATRVLSLCQRRIQNDWQQHYQHPLLLLETFVDPSRFTAPSIVRPTGIVWARPRALNESVPITSLTANRNGSLSTLFSAMHASSYRNRCYPNSITVENPDLCLMHNT